MRFKKNKVSQFLAGALLVQCNIGIAGELYTINVNTEYQQESGNIKKCKAYVTGDTNHHNVTYNFQQIGNNSTLLQVDSTTRKSSPGFYLNQSNINDDDGSESCLLTEARMEGIGKAWIADQTQVGGNGQQSRVTFNTLKGKIGPIEDWYVAGQLLALPIAAKISGDHSLVDDMNVLVNNAGLNLPYEKYAKMITSGANGINGNRYGFSTDFLELKTTENIERFLQEVSVELAYELGLLGENLNHEDLAYQVRVHTLMLLEQEITLEYGSSQHIEASLALKYSDQVNSTWQINRFTNSYNILSNISNVSKEFYYDEDVSNEISAEYGVSTLGDILDYFTLSEDYEILDINFARSILQQNNGVRVDFEKGLITNENRYGGYLGKTYISIAADVYGVDAKDLTRQQKLLVKTALNVIGIDTNYAYGSIANIKASLMTRLDGNADTDTTLDDVFKEGYSIELMEELQSQQGWDFEQLQKELLFDTYVFSGIDSLTEEEASQPDPDGFYIYDQNDKQGERLKITESMPFLGDFNDRMKSYSIPEGMTVRFYEHGNYTGSHWTRDSGSSVNAFDFLEKASSVKIIKTPVNDEFPVILYEHPDRTGHQYKVSGSIPYLENFDNVMSSWSIPDGVTVQFYDRPNYQGEYWTRTSDSYHNADGFHDRIRSVAVYSEHTGSEIREELIVFENMWMDGEHKYITGDMANLGDWNDRISSWSIPNGMTVRFYEHANFQGGYHTRTSNSMNADGFNDDVGSIQIIRRRSASEGDAVERQRTSASNTLFDSLNEVNALAENISRYNKVVDYDAEGIAVHSVPFSDSLFSKALLYSVGLDKAFVDRRWEDFLEQRNSMTPSLRPFFSAGEGVPPLIQRKFNEIIDKFERETGNSHRYTVQDMWSHEYDKMVDEVSAYMASNILFQARLSGRTSWRDHTLQDAFARLATGYDVVRQRHNSLFWKETDVIGGNNWVINGPSLNYSAILKNTNEAFFELYGLGFENPEEEANTRFNSLFFYLNKDRVNECRREISHHDDLYITCTPHETSWRESLTTEHEILENIIHAFLMNQKSTYKSITDGDLFLGILKSFLPVWGTIDDIKAGNTLMATMGVIGDVFFFVPLVDDIADASRLTIRSIKASKVSNTKFLSDPLALSDGNKAIIASNKLDKRFYRQEAAKAIAKVPLNALMQLNPIEVGSIDDLISVGKVDLPRLPDNFRPSDTQNPQHFVDSLYLGNTNSIVDNFDGTSTINGDTLVVNIAGNYYTVAKNPDGQIYLTDAHGNNIAPIINTNGSWQIDWSQVVDHADVNGMITLDFPQSSFEKLDNGLFKKGEQYAIEVDGVFYEVLWDPVYDSWYMYDSEWNRVLVSGDYDGKWFVNNVNNVCSIM